MILSLCPLAGLGHGAGVDWDVYLGDKASTQFSSLDQINRENVHRLRAAWSYHSGDAGTNNLSQIQCNPLIKDGILYGTTPGLKLVALDAATGRELWRFDPFADSAGFNALGVNRGLVYWEDGGTKRILYGAAHYLYAIDAETGKPVSSFGDAGRVDLKLGLGRDVSKLSLLSNTPGVVYKHLLIVPLRLGEGPAPAAPGHIRAYDLRTGKIAWRFNTIPHPGEFGYDTWPPDAYTYVGGANVWTGMAVDEERGLLFCPTGAAAFDFWGGNRIGKNLFANCLIALDAATGRRIWHYQFVHHDLWDRDLASPPNLVRVRHRGRTVDAVAQCTKSGHVFVFDRETGEPLFPIVERPVPASDLQGESAWPTQPLPTQPLPFARQLFTYEEITQITPEAHQAVLNRFVTIRPHAPFAPPSMEGTVIFPGFDGGAEWGGSAVDPATGVLYVNANEMPWILTMVKTQGEDVEFESSGEQLYAQICAACHGVDREGNVGHNVPSLAGVETRLKRPDVLALLQNGKGVMPSVAFLTDGQKAGLIDYIFGVAPSDTQRGDEVPIGSHGAMGRSPYGHTGYNRWLDPNGYPAVKPPWGTLNAIDLNSGHRLWTVPLGEFPELTARGIPPTGAENYGGPIVTAGDLIFIAASKDEMFRAFDKETGKVLWQTKLPAGGYATPATYAVDGRQFVVIACGGGKMGTPSGDTYVAFALE